MSEFAAYLDAYADAEEARNIHKTAWSPTSISRGIVQLGLDGLACLLMQLHSNNNRIPKSRRISDGVLVVDEIIEYKGIRVSLVATDLPGLVVQPDLLREVNDRLRETLCLCILPTSEQSIWPLKGTDQQTGAGGLIPIYPSDVDALAQERMDFLELLEYKLYRRLILDKADADTQFHIRFVDEFRALKATGGKFEHFENLLFNSLAEGHREWVEHPQLSRVVRTLERGRGCLLIGPSSSGKSVLALQSARVLSLAGYPVYYTNLGSVGALPVECFGTFLFSEPGDRPAIVIADDLQSNPAVARYLLAIASTAHRIRMIPVTVIMGISWIDFSKEATAWHEDCLPIAVRSHQVRSRIVREFADVLSEEDLVELSKKLGEDLFLLQLSLEQSKRLGHRVSLGEIAEDVWGSRTRHAKVSEEEAIRVALVAGSLGRYDIVVPTAFLKRESQVGEACLSNLLDARLLRRQGPGLSIGHRSLCGLLIDWLETRGGWRSLSRVGAAGNTTTVVLDYLKSLGSSLAVDSLRALHVRAGFKERPQLNRRAATIVEIWQAFNAVVERIEQQQSIDPTWGKVPSSAMFAIQTFAEIGKLALTLDSLEFLRHHWTLQGSDIIIVTDGFSTQADFRQIQIAMKEEDELAIGSEQVWATRVSADQIDIDRFHRTWVAGLILCAEAAAVDPRVPLEQLAEAVERQQLEGGAFYPARVPWCTARVLLGLAACGRTVDTSIAVRATADWLLRELDQGGACRAGIWQSGTGRWNSDLEATGMVLLALAAVGIDCSDGRIAAARSYLLSQRSLWVASGKELDGALAIQAYLDTGGAWEEIAQEAQRLSQWARGEAFWRTATKSAQESLDQSCRVAQIASHLISIGWSAIRSDLPSFLDALATPEAYRAEMVGTPSVAIPASPGPRTQKVTDAIVESLRAMTRLSLSEYTVVGKYRRFDERVRNRLRDWHQRIAAPLLTPTITHENFLIWAAPGSGKTFLIQEVAHSLGNRATYFELNLARQSQNDFVQALEAVRNSPTPSLCLLDEIDARAEETWPYEVCFSLLDLNLQANLAVVFILIGSSSAGMQGMLRGMAARSKGKDLLDRVPNDRRFEVPALALEDRAVVVAGQVLDVAAERQQRIVEIEKLALYYALTNQDLQSPRQLRDLAVSAVQRLAQNENRLKYDDLFFSGDRRNQQFWVDHQEAAAELSSTYVRLEV